MTQSDFIPIIVMYALLIPSAAVFMYCKSKSMWLLATVFKGLSTWIIIGGALVLAMGSQLNLFTVLIIAGLAMGLAGDVALSLPAHGLRSGMLFFALGHVCAVIAMFFALGTVTFIPLPIAVALFVLLMFVQRKLGVSPPDNLRIPVIAYTAIISCMLALALVMPFYIFPNGLILLFAGLVFTVSDLALAINSFPKQSSSDDKGSNAAKSTVFSLSCYFLGQSLFAVSVFFFG